jgi:hypothetical protein
MARTPTYSPHIRFQCAGQFGPVGGAWEIFSYGLSVGGAGAVSAGADVLEDACQDLIDFHVRQATGISSTARLTSIKAAYVQADGTWQGAEAAYEVTGSWPGGAVNNGSEMPHAPQVALAVTLRTASNTPRTRGRFFLPAPAWGSLSADGLVAEVQAGSTAGSVVQLIQALNNQPGFDQGDDRVIVASTFGANTPVTSVSVGRVLDTIRSRRNALREAYVSAVV